MFYASWYDLDLVKTEIVMTQAVWNTYQNIIMATKSLTDLTSA